MEYKRLARREGYSEMEMGRRIKHKMHQFDFNLGIALFIKKHT
jgi:hypothetical protein